MFGIGFLLGALIATRLMSGLFLWLTKSWKGGVQRLAVVHFASLITAGLLGGTSLSIDDRFAGIYAIGIFLLPQICWFVFDTVRYKRAVKKLEEDNRISKIDSLAPEKLDGHAQISNYRTRLLKKAEDGNPDAQYELGLSYAQGMEVEEPYIYIEPDYDEAIHWWCKAGDQGNTFAQVNLAFMYATGRSGTHDEVKAYVWWCKAAEAGHAGAQYELGQIHSDKAREVNIRSEAIAGDLVEGQEAKQEMSKAVLWMQKAGEQGYVDAQTWLGSILGYHLEENPQNAKETIKWCRMAANQGDPWAQFFLANLYADGIGIPQNWAEATRWYLAAAEQGNDYAQRTLGHMYASGEILPKNYFEAAKWWQLAAIRERRERYVTCIGMEYTSSPDYSAEAMAWLCDTASNGSPLAQSMVKNLCARAEKNNRTYLKQANFNKLDRGGDGDRRPWIKEGYVVWYLGEDQASMTSLRDHAKKGVAEAQLALGFVLGDSHEDEKQTEAVKWFQLAAEQRTFLAQRILGDLYLHGMYGIEENEVEALKWYQMAADQGDTEAWCQLGCITYSKVADKWPQVEKYDSSGSRIWPEEYLEPVRWYSKAAEKGHAVAQHYLAELYVKGRGVPKDHVAAVKWQCKAAKQGYAKAQKALAEMYTAEINFLGDGISQDSPEAVKWFKRASVQGSIATESEETGAGALEYAYYRGRGVAQDGAEAMKWHRIARNR